MRIKEVLTKDQFLALHGGRYGVENDILNKEDREMRQNRAETLLTCSPTNEEKDYFDVYLDIESLKHHICTWEMVLIPPCRRDVLMSAVVPGSKCSHVKAYWAIEEDPGFSPYYGSVQFFFEVQVLIKNNGGTEERSVCHSLAYVHWYKFANKNHDCHDHDFWLEYRLKATI